MASDAMKILFVTDEPPWPARSGYQLRMSQALDALSEIGAVDLAVTVSAYRPHGADPRGQKVSRIIELPLRGAAGGRGGVAARWLRSDDPRVLLRTDWTAAERTLRSWMRSDYDLAWFSHIPVHHALGHLARAPSVVDIDDLHGVVLADRPDAGPILRRPGHRKARPTAGFGRVARLTNRVDQRRWRNLDRQTAESATNVVVCSDLDRRRLGVTNAVVVPNGYPRPTVTERREPGLRPTITMIGKLMYEPNLDGAHAFVEHVLPRVREQLPDVEFRLIGKYRRREDVRWLAHQPGVCVLGEVPDVASELLGADAVVVPLRFGGGTRIKILEAFAYSAPVVSTSIGAEGLEVVDGEHLVIANSVEDFAQACVRLLRDRNAGDALARAAHQLYDSRYASDRVSPAVRSLAHQLTGCSRP
jgi:glycosyltransferase involved in cell wall biosynthesis